MDTSQKHFNDDWFILLSKIFIYVELLIYCIEKSLMMAPRAIAVRNMQGDRHR